MADTFAVRTQYPTVEFLGGGQTRDVMAIGYVTKPSGIYFEVRMPKALYSAAQVRNYGIGYSGTIEACAAIPGIEEMVYTQTQNRAGVLVDNFVVYVSSTSGDSADSIVLPFSDLNVEFAKPKVDRLRKELDAAEAS
jgi:hypothetical protein